MKRLFPVVVTVGVIAGVGLVAGLGVRAFLDPVPMERLQRLRKGMTQAEVRQVLGQPSRIYPDGLNYAINGSNYTTSTQWTYQRPLVFGFVNIHWQADGTYDGQYNYERF